MRFNKLYRLIEESQVLADTMNEMLGDIHKVLSKLLSRGPGDWTTDEGDVSKAMMAYYLKMGDKAKEAGDPLAMLILCKAQDHGELYHNALMGMGDETKKGMKNLTTLNSFSMEEALDTLKGIMIKLQE